MQRCPNFTSASFWGTFQFFPHQLWAETCRSVNQQEPLLLLQDIPQKNRTESLHADSFPEPIVTVQRKNWTHSTQRRIISFVFWCADVWNCSCREADFPAESGKSRRLSSGVWLRTFSGRNKKGPLCNRLLRRIIFLLLLFPAQTHTLKQVTVTVAMETGSQVRSRGDWGNFSDFVLEKRASVLLKSMTNGDLEAPHNFLFCFWALNASQLRYEHNID